MDRPMDETTVRHVAHLARLKLSDDEVARFAGQLSEILGYVAQLSEVDVDGVEPTAHALSVTNVFRQDAARPTGDPHDALHNAPQHEAGCFRVPKVLDTETA